MRTAALLVVATLLVVPGCSGTGNGNGGKFCDLLSESVAGTDFTTPQGAAVGAQRLRNLLAQAPTEIRDDVRNLQEAVRDMEAAATPERIEAARSGLARPDTQTAILNLANFRSSYC